MVGQRDMFGHRVACKPVYVWMPLLLGCVAVASWLLKHKEVQEILHPRSGSTLEQYLYESQREQEKEAKDNTDTSKQPDITPKFRVKSDDELPREETQSDELRLVDHLLSHYKQYGRVARPIRDSSRKIKVYFGLRLIKFDISEKEQTMKTSAWVRMQWRDEYLRWNLSEYGNIVRTIVPWDKIWIPDITLVNTAETDIDIRHADVMVNHTGWVAFIPHRVYTSACLIDVTMFPYDKHVCEMWFQSMSRFSEQMDLKLDSEDKNEAFEVSTYLSSFKESMLWDIVNTTADRHVRPSQAGAMIKYSKRVSLRFTLSIKRRAAYISMLLMVPCVFLGSCTLVIFCLPPDRPDRINLAMSLLASFFVLILILVETAPPSAAAIPLLAKYYACVALLIMASPFLSGVVVNISRRGDTRKAPPAFLRTLCLEGLTWPLFLHDRWRYIQEVENIPPMRAPTSQRRLLPNRHCFQPERSLDIVSQVDMEMALETLQNGHHQDDDNTNEVPNQSSEPVSGVQRRLERIESTVTRILDSQSMVSHQNSGYTENMYRHLVNDPTRLQWKLIAQVMDRLCFCVYLIVIILSYILFFPRP